MSKKQTWSRLKLSQKKKSSRRQVRDRVRGTRPKFIDLFAGCGGLSLGLVHAGWQGIFAIEENKDAFNTLRHNLLSNNSARPYRKPYSWPDSVPMEPFDIREFRRQYSDILEDLSGSIQLVAGGPPCQGFSYAGRRNPKDPRNQLFKEYVEFVKILQPDLILLENVEGIGVAHGKKKWMSNGKKGRPRKSYAKKIMGQLDEEYRLEEFVLRACDFGVPQVRPRHFILGVRRNRAQNLILDGDLFFEKFINEAKIKLLAKHGLPRYRPITVKEAISDLITNKKKLVECTDSDSPNGFKQIALVRPRTKYQQLMHCDVGSSSVNSLRLPNHRVETVRKFQKILDTCQKGRQLSESDRKRLGVGKHVIVPMAPDRPAPTITTLPDDYLHYQEPRIHTVREHARLQSFPDWFNFIGKYTTGGKARSSECPRYSQVGNAVAPMVAEGLGIALRKIVSKLNN